MEEKLYRYISFETFVNLLVSKKDMFKRPCKWEDTYEGFMLSMLDKKLERKEVIKTLFEIVSPKNPKATIDNYMRLWYAKWSCYGQCWTKESENDAMWRIYSYDKKAIRIKTTATRIKEMLQCSPTTSNFNVKIQDVKYDIDGDNFLELQAELLRNNKSVCDPFFHKRKAFEHENEKRVLIIDNTRDMTTLLSSYFANRLMSQKYTECSHENKDKEILEILEESIDKYVYEFSTEKIPDILYAEKINVVEYIESVMIHPQAENWIVELVEQLCQTAKIHCEGRSSLYERPFR